MLINLRNALMGGKRLPYDAEVEYLESTGTQYINSGIVPTSDLAYQIVAAAQTYETDRVVAGGRGSAASANQRILQYAQNNVRQLCLQRGDHAIRLAIPYDSDFHVFFSSATTLRIDDTETTSNAASDSGEESFFALFGNSVAGVAQSFSSCRISSARLWRGSTLVRDFIPVRKGTVGYLYDRVSRKLFGNAGTGDFVLGPDVVPVEYIESHGTEWIDTGYALNTDTDVLSIVYQNTSVLNHKWIWGSYEANAQVGCSSATISAPTVWYKGAIPVAKDAQYNSPHTLTLDANGASNDGVVLSSFKSIVGTYNLYLFTLNYDNSGSASGYLGYAMIYGYKHRRNGVLVRDFIPVRVGTDTTSWEGAMMDVLTRRIYRNAGTGAFTYGNDLKYPIPAE